MKNFLRVVRLAFRYRITFVVSVVCALGVAVLWGANIGAIFPIIKVVLNNESLQQWVDNEIVDSRQTAAEKSDEIERLTQELAAAPPERQKKIQIAIATAESCRDAEQKAEQRYIWMKPYVDSYMPTSPFRTVVLIVGLLLVGTIVKDLFLISQNILVARLAQLSVFELRKLFFRRTLRMNLSTFGNDGTADLMSRFTHDMEHVVQGVTTLFGKVVREPLKMVACLVGAALICWRLLVLSLVLAPVAAFLIHWLSKILKKANRRAMEEMAGMYTTLEEVFRSIKIVKAFTNESQERKRFHDQSKQYYKKSMRIARYDSLCRPINEVMGAVAISIALLVGAWLTLTQETHLFGILMSPQALSVPGLLIFYGMLAGVADPVRKFSDVFTSLQRAAAASDRIFGHLDREPEIRNAKNPQTVGRHHQDLVFDAVSFEYLPGKPVLQNVSLSIPSGQTVAIVGPNGCGKSTLANLVLRFYDPTTGSVRLDGVALTDMRLRDLRCQIGLVTQETLLFDDTIFNNIRYGNPQADDSEVIAAARRAQAHDFIENELPAGYDTVVGTMGGRLSGGQRQRIALARAILRDPAILLLDEATSQVDLESEKAIQEVLEEFTRDRTTIIITHRLAVLKLADQIVVMQSGRILDTGTHDELLVRCDLYRRLYQIQFEHAEGIAAA